VGSSCIALRTIVWHVFLLMPTYSVEKLDFSQAVITRRRKVGC
jgi:hypothetical protein